MRKSLALLISLLLVPSLTLTATTTLAGEPTAVAKKAPVKKAAANKNSGKGKIAADSSAKAKKSNAFGDFTAGVVGSVAQTVGTEVTIKANAKAAEGTCKALTHKKNRADCDTGF